MDDCGHIPAWTGDRVQRTNVRGYHCYCEDFKAWIVEQAMRPGMSMAGLAMRNQVNANQLRRWVQLHRRHGQCQTSPARLLPVTVQAQTMAAPMPKDQRGVQVNAAIEIELAGAVVRVRDDVTPATLRLVLQALRDAGP